MPSRIIKETIIISESLTAISAEAERFFWRLVVKADDFGLYVPGDREAWATLRPGDLVVTPPCDAHKPGCCPGEPAPLKKVCVKVLVD